MFWILKTSMQQLLFIQPTDSEEIANIISSLNINTASGPFSIPSKILILLKQNISKQLPHLFNLSFSSCFFLSILKTAEVVPVFKLDYCNDRSISLLSNVGKILEKRMYKRSIISWLKTTLFMTWSLVPEKTFLLPIP